MKMKDIFLVLLIFLGNCHGISVYSTCRDTQSESHLLQLKEYLFCKYDRDVRPTLDYKNATVVSFGLVLSKFDVNDFTNIIDVHVLTRMTWTDDHLTWTPSRFDEISTLKVQSHELWIPDIVAHSATDLDLEIEMPTTQCLLQHKGNVLCVPMRVYTAHCDADHTWWPYDTMNCTLHFASWSHSKDEIDFQFLNFQTGEQGEMNSQNTEWNLVKTSTIVRAVDSKFHVDFSSNMLSVSMLLKRHSSLRATAYITLALVLMTITLMALWLEPKSNERMIIANLNFVLHLLCLQALQWQVPFNGSRSPRIFLFYENSLVLATFSLILTSILRYLQELNTEAPVWISSGTDFVLKSKVGQILLVSILDPKVTAKMDISSDDNTNLVSLERKKSTWVNCTILIGWFTFFSVFFAYVIMLACLPTSASGDFALKS